MGSTVETPEFKKKSEIQKKNRKGGDGHPSTHTGGSRSHGTYAADLVNFNYILNYYVCLCMLLYFLLMNVIKSFIRCNSTKVYFMTVTFIYLQANELKRKPHPREVFKHTHFKAGKWVDEKSKRTHVSSNVFHFLVFFLDV